jgi:hypothetical protein
MSQARFHVSRHFDVIHLHQQRSPFLAVPSVSLYSSFTHPTQKIFALLGGVSCAC